MATAILFAGDQGFSHSLGHQHPKETSHKRWGSVPSHGIVVEAATVFFVMVGETIQAALTPDVEVRAVLALNAPVVSQGPAVASPIEPPMAAADPGRRRLPAAPATPLRACTPSRRHGRTPVGRCLLGLHATSLPWPLPWPPPLWPRACKGRKRRRIDQRE
uniref:Uncharacterized protein n=1 Tax=Leersia perrieri TaxID=77586 RepID=A0A0D9XQZ9_9ORYZ